MSVFVDTSALYALLVRTEERHEDVLRAFRSLVTAERSLHATSYVVVETAALLQRRVGLAAVRDLATQMLPAIEVEWVDEELHERGMRRLLREDRRGLSLVDCVSLEFMRGAGIRSALALDPDLADGGAELIPAQTHGGAR